MFACFFALCVAFAKTDSLKLFVASILAVAVFIPLCKAAGHAVGAQIMIKKNRNKPDTLRKFSDQSWQLVVHVAMTGYEMYLLSRSEVRWSWWNDIAGLKSTWEPIDQSKDFMLNLFYIVQLAIWFYTAFSHRFMDGRHKDYLAMFTHHIATIILVGGSWSMGCLRIGLLVLLLHDSSDIVADMLKLSNYLGYDSDGCGIPLTELLFVANLASWFYTRLYQFPFHVNNSVATHRQMFCKNPDGSLDPTNDNGTWLMLQFLYFLQILHVWWFLLFIRMAYRLLTQSTKEAQEEYDSDASDKED
jgi:ceramide synthetase